MPASVDNPDLMVSCKRWRTTPVGYEATQANLLAQMPTIILCEARGLWLCWVIRGGIGSTRRLGTAWSSTRCLMSVWILSLEPERRRTERSPPRHESLGSPGVLCNAQAACGFSCSASKRSSFFQSVRAMAAILRANVRRAISGFMPFASKAT
jgi:hypothetical protein